MIQQLHDELSCLGQAQLTEVLAFVEALKAESKPLRPRLEKIVGGISAEDLAAMKLAIEQDCEHAPTAAS
ncbi:hypothetical protein [Aeoliella sp. SH292]|uniref:hypothetical protein n=1 Tax=Aeoliella sp. SH292 TaxID=3454464 RepID=UPI003F9AFD9C